MPMVHLEFIIGIINKQKETRSCEMYEKQCIEQRLQKTLKAPEVTMKAYFFGGGGISAYCVYIPKK